jgi:hypothetical protein
MLFIICCVTFGIQNEMKMDNTLRKHWDFNTRCYTTHFKSRKNLVLSEEAKVNIQKCRDYLDENGISFRANLWYQYWIWFLQC